MTISQNWVKIEPKLEDNRAARLLLRECARHLSDGGMTGLAPETIATVRSGITHRADALPAAVAAHVRLVVSVLCDLRQQGWQIRVQADAVEVAVPHDDTTDPMISKARVRASHLLDRDEQLRHPAVQKFVRGMERRRLWKGEWHSVVSLMREGRELADELLATSRIDDVRERASRLRASIDPYVQVVVSGLACEFTGLQLTDIWRYFRHTWNTSYNSTPGRKIWFLVRDRSAKCHPIIGIAALGNAIVQLSPRDTWIGWTPDTFLRRLREGPARRWNRWIGKSLESLIGDVYTIDFLESGVLTPDDIRVPGESAVRRLKELAERSRKRHSAFPERSSHKGVSAGRSESAWRLEAESHLFRAKRALTLAALLDAKRLLAVAGFDPKQPARLPAVLNDLRAQQAIRTILRQTKGKHVGLDMMDITICGAVAPYNALLGGKLVALLMASPEVRGAYVRKYRGASSIIASAMAGKAVRRRPRLVLLGTTSLYAAGSSQYNRIKLPAEAVRGTPGSSVSFESLGHSRGFGSFHFSRNTLREFDLVMAHSHNGRRVNSIFGEGVNPKLRKVREALDLVGLRADILLRHGSPRIVYGIALASNFREILLGIDSKPKYIIPEDLGSTEALSDYWRYRWLAQRIRSAEVLTSVRSQATSYPLNHGARVSLPEMSDAPDTLFGSESLDSAVRS